MNDASISTRKSMCALNREDTSSLPHIRESGIQQFFCCWNLESRGLESGIHNGLESGIHYGMESRIHYGMDSGIQKAGIQRPGSGIQDLRGFSYMGQSSCVQALVTSSCAWVFLVQLHTFSCTCAYACVKHVNWPYGQSLLGELHCSFSFKKMLQRYIPKVQCMAV